MAHSKARRVAAFKGQKQQMHPTHGKVKSFEELSNELTEKKPTIQPKDVDEIEY